MLARLIAAALVLVGTAGPARAQHIPDLTPAQWREEVAALVAGLEGNHRDTWNYTPRAEVARLADRAIAQAARADDHEMIVALQRIAAGIGDGHTFVAVSDLYSRYPFEVRWIEDGFHVVRAVQGRSDLLGTKLIAIDGMETGEAAGRAIELVPRNENRWYERHAVAQLLTQAEPLAALGIARRSRGAVFTFENREGRLVRVRLAPSASSTRPELLAIGRSGRPVPAPSRGGLRASMLEDVAYLDFGSYDRLAQDGPLVWAAVDRARARALIIDFRENGGGSLPAGRNHVVYPAWERSQLNREGCLFVLTGPATFSAAMTNVTDLRRETEAILIGQPTGARPNGYQENQWFTLPHSGLRVSAAQRRYRFGAPGERAVMPDIQVEQTVGDLRAGKDTVLAAALSQAQRCEPRPSPR